MAQPVVAFDIETIPDVAGLRRLHKLPDTISDDDVVSISRRLLRQTKNNDFFSPPLQRVAVISCVARHLGGEPFKIFSLPHKDNTSETEAIKSFYRLIDKHQPILVSWNGGGFDLPVLQYRAVLHQLQANTYNKTDEQFKWDNYINRFHERHSDLMDIMGMYQPRNNVSLNDFAVLCGLPGKIGIGGAAVWDFWQQQEYAAVRHYCENDALLTYLLYVRYQHFRGKLTDIAEEEKLIVEYLQNDGSRWQEFLSQWQKTESATTQAPRGGLFE